MNKLCTVSKNNSDVYIVNSAYFDTLVIEETKSGKVNAYKEGGKCFFKGLELLEDERDIMKLSDYVKETQTKYVARMTAKLPTMCAALHLSQADLAAKLNISRQQVVAIETGKRKMSWSIFLSLILIFELDAEASLMMKAFEIYTPELMTLLGSNDLTEQKEGIKDEKVFSLQCGL